MTNEEEVILALKELKDWEGLPYCIEEPMQNEGIAVITKEALDMAIEALEQTRWISVSERLPEIGQRILVTYNQEDEVKIDITYYTKHGFLLSVVIAWMPLPQPYKAESEE